MGETLGQRISESRKAQGITQEELAEKLGVSAQAVSKWENDLSCPDIMLLPRIGDLLGMTTDELLRGEKKQTVMLVPEEKRKSLDDMVFRIQVRSADNDKVNVNLPMSLIRLCVEIGVQLPQFEGNEALKNIDFKQIFDLVERGVIGKLVEVESGDGDIVEISVE